MSNLDFQLLFLHLPKCGGTTMVRLLRQLVERHEFVWLRSPDFEVDLEVLIQGPPEILASKKVICGHMPFGLHHDLSGPYRYMTMLRHPVERVLSAYYYWMNKTDHPLSTSLRNGEIDIFKYIELEHDNTMTRILGATKIDFGTSFWELIPGDSADRTMFESAWNNLVNNIDVLGLCERFDESLRQLSNLTQTTFSHYEKQNVTPQRPKLESHSPDIIAAIESRNEWDLRLYKNAQTLFEQRLS